LTWRQLETLHRIHLAYVDVAVAQPYPCNTAFTEVFFHFEFAVAVGVAQRDYARGLTAASSLHRDIQIAIRRGHGMAGRTQIIGDHERAKASRESQPSVVAVTGWRRSPGEQNCAADQAQPQRAANEIGIQHVNSVLAE
jgi:hypothetical protein